MPVAEQKFITGLIYVNEQERPNLLELLHLPEQPLARLPEDQLRPSREALADMMASL